MDPVLKIKDLTVSIAGRRVIDGVSFELFPGRIMALVGESGSGKTLTALSILDLLPGTSTVESGSVLFGGKDIFLLDEASKRRIRGNDIAMAFQEPFTALNPVMRVGVQVLETIKAHKGLSLTQASVLLGDLFERVKLPKGAERSYPHELSGGMRQRVMLAMALSCEPEVLILDEPTTALDVSVQKHILELIRDLQREKHFAVLFITHDFSVVNMIADEVCVMRRGEVVEKGFKKEILNSPEHPYTRKIIGCIPRLGDGRRRLPE